MVIFTTQDQSLIRTIPAVHDANLPSKGQGFASISPGGAVGFNAGRWTGSNGVFAAEFTENALQALGSQAEKLDLL